MARLEELKPGVTVKGILPDGFISVVNVSWIGSVAIELTYFYAFKQAETDTSGTASTGWETFLFGIVNHGFTITGTWPMRTEMKSRQIAMGTNALASSIVLTFSPRPPDAPMATRREFLNALKQELPDALRLLQIGSIAPVDLAQAAIGPGMAVFSRYSKVLEADGSPMGVRTALILINQMLDEVLAEQEGEFDADTRRWAGETLAYNSIVLAWPEITRLAQVEARSDVAMYEDADIFQQE